MPSRCQWAKDIVYQMEYTMQVLYVFCYVYFHTKPQSCYRPGYWNQNSVFVLAFGNQSKHREKLLSFCRKTLSMACTQITSFLTIDMLRQPVALAAGQQLYIFLQWYMLRSQGKDLPSRNEKMPCGDGGQCFSRVWQTHTQYFPTLYSCHKMATSIQAPSSGCLGFLTMVKVLECLQLQLLWDVQTGKLAPSAKTSVHIFKIPDSIWVGFITF